MALLGDDEKLDNSQAIDDEVLLKVLQRADKANKAKKKYKQKQPYTQYSYIHLPTRPLFHDMIQEYSGKLGLSMAAYIHGLVRADMEKNGYDLSFLDVKPPRQSRKGLKKVTRLDRWKIKHGIAPSGKPLMNVPTEDAPDNGVCDDDL